MIVVFLLACFGAVGWQHPAGMITEDTVAEVRAKIAGHELARRAYDEQKSRVEEWVSVSSEKLAKVFPTKRGNVYHNFSCPDDRTRLDFDPFNPGSFHCSTCGKDFSPDTDAGIYPPGNRYHGTMYDGWACLFYLTAPSRVMDMAVMARIENEEKHFDRAIEILLLFAKTIAGLPTDLPGPGGQARILTYQREGDNKILMELAVAYELLRDRMTPEQRARVEKDVLQRMLDDVMLEPIYPYDHNNVYQWHRTIIQTALALDREDLIDWSFGYGDYAPDLKPEHRGLQKIIATHFKPDGAYWELCSGYHLYPMYHFCELAVLSRNLSRMDPARFPPEAYDLTHKDNAGAKVIKAALEWFVSMAMPDRTMTVIGDSMDARSGMDEYVATAEIGYRLFDVRAVGDYEKFREGKRSWTGLLYGAPEIVQRPTPFTSSYLSSGWISLRNEWEGNRVWVGLNALTPGGGHQHADRLSMTWYSHDTLLALEKATPYNESVTRNLGTYSQSHNAVTVDVTSQKQGEALQADEIPEVAVFFSGSFLKFAELRADNLYPQTKVYRRSVAVIEDIVLDLFRVEGGKTHDWIVNHAGPRPKLSVPMQPSSFEPADWLYHGGEEVLHAEVDGDWSARWQVDGVTSRLTMLAGKGTGVFALETYPIENAVVTPEHPPCQTLCVRRTNDAPFLAVWDAWRDSPNLEQVKRVGTGEALFLRTKSNTYYVLFGSGGVEFSDGVALKSNAAFSLVRQWDAVAFAGGTWTEVRSPDGHMRVELDQKGNVAAECPDGTMVCDKTQPIHYDTFGGEDHRRPSAALAVTFAGNLLRARK